jgi:hypothetical protein
MRGEEVGRIAWPSGLARPEHGDDTNVASGGAVPGIGIDAVDHAIPGDDKLTSARQIGAGCADIGLIAKAPTGRAQSVPACPRIRT